jgi:hypothetical protein
MACQGEQRPPDTAGRELARTASTFMQEAQESGDVRDIYRLAGMASSLNTAARELCQRCFRWTYGGMEVSLPAGRIVLIRQCAFGSG